MCVVTVQVPELFSLPFKTMIPPMPTRPPPRAPKEWLFQGMKDKEKSENLIKRYNVLLQGNVQAQLDRKAKSRKAKSVQFHHRATKEDKESWDTDPPIPKNQDSKVVARLQYERSSWSIK